MTAGDFYFSIQDSRQNFITKIGVIDERSLKKSKKHHARASGESASTVNRKLQLILRIWNSSPDSPDSPDSQDVVAWTATRDPPSTRAGGKDDVSS